jgi:hypothetical protein
MPLHTPKHKNLVPIVEAHLMHNAHLLATLKAKCFYSYGDGVTRGGQLEMVYHENELISEERKQKRGKALARAVTNAA